MGRGHYNENCNCCWFWNSNCGMSYENVHSWKDTSTMNSLTQLVEPKNPMTLRHYGRFRRRLCLIEIKSVGSWQLRETLTELTLLTERVPVRGKNSTGVGHSLVVSHISGLWEWDWVLIKLSDRIEVSKSTFPDSGSNFYMTLERRGKRTRTKEGKRRGHY